MRLMLAVALLCLPCAAQAQMSKAKCEELSKLLGEFARVSGNVERVLGGLNLKAMVAGAGAEIRRSAVPTDEARIKLVIALYDYIGHSEELARQLRLCNP